jgi:desulfoferrodoxin (superoxide reductase-like protein)
MNQRVHVPRIKMQMIAVPVIMSRAGVAHHNDNLIQHFVRWVGFTTVADMSMPCTSTPHGCMFVL